MEEKTLHTGDHRERLIEEEKTFETRAIVPILRRYLHV